MNRILVAAAAVLIGLAGCKGTDSGSFTPPMFGAKGEIKTPNATANGSIQTAGYQPGRAGSPVQQAGGVVQPGGGVMPAMAQNGACANGTCPTGVCPTGACATGTCPTGNCAPMVAPLTPR